MRITSIILLLAAVLLTEQGFSQRIRLEHADVLKGGQIDGVRITRPTGNVIFQQNQTRIFCDSAILRKSDNTVEAFGKIKILEGDSITITAGKLFYDGNTRIAKLRSHVVLTKLNTLRVITDFLDYYRNKNLAIYFNGGRVIDTTNILISKKGYLNTISSIAAFKKDVIGENQDFTFKSDTLQYNTKTKVVNFLAPATVTDKDGKVANYKQGFYNTITKLSVLNDGVLESKSNRMKGDHYKIDDLNQFYQATGHVVITSKTDNLVIFGDQADYFKKKGITKVFGHAYLIRFDESSDTLFLGADTLVSVEGQDGKSKYLLAYHHVKVFNKEMQAVADSLSYLSSDSIMTFYRDPVLWNIDNQMTADTIQMEVKKKNIDRIFLTSNSFVAGEDELKNFNQIKGRKMTAYLKNKKIHHVDVEGNGESLYYALEEKKLKIDTVQARLILLTGVNKIICSNMKINFLEGKVNNISFYVQPDAKFIPPQELKNDEAYLKGFSWRNTERPDQQAVTGKPVPAKTPDPPQEKQEP